MAGPFARIIAQVIITGVGMASRAFMAAYGQAVANAKSGKTIKQAADAATGKKKMDYSQALQVLNVEENCTKQVVDKQFNKYFERNDPSKGGSFYIQSKIFRAKEAIEAHDAANKK